YITSLDMAGCSLTVLKLDGELRGLWDAPVLTPALQWGLRVWVTSTSTGWCAG
ncbi:MAG: dihydroxyacetone kinase subunit DhaK, partial [Kineosporiaceae bacterium]